MKEVFYSSERGITKNAWLLSKHSFPFNDYINKKRQKFGALLVLNEDFVSPGKGFPMHSHDNMEIITLVISGKLKHQDSEDNSGVIKAGEVQLMSAGQGVSHSEMNASKDHPVHFFQIWIEPAERNLPVSYESREFLEQDYQNQLKLIASGNGEKNSLLIHQDAKILTGNLNASSKHEYVTRADRGVYVQIISGDCLVQGLKVQEGDAVLLYDEALTTIESKTATKILILDVPFKE